MTYTLLAADLKHGLLGVTTASKSLAVGHSVPAIDPTCGAVASQAWTNPALRHHMLNLIRAGTSAAEAVREVPHLDEHHDYRQVGVIDRAGGIGVHTGKLTSEWSGHIAGAHHAAIGNFLAGPDVLQAMSRHFGAPAQCDEGAEMASASFARRLMGALSAGERAGGDLRGRESAALSVARISDTLLYPPELAIDLRVDRHREPVDELNSLLEQRLRRD